MIQDFSDMCTALYCIVDDLYQPLAKQHDHRPGPRAACSDSEVITLSLLAEILGLDEEVAFLAHMKRHGRPCSRCCPSAVATIGGGAPCSA